ncbi:MAG: peptidyl-prolyl cis-trans isomerase [Candidatus Omnitrophota bacterium]
MKKNVIVTIGVIILLVIVNLFITKKVSNYTNCSQQPAWTDKLQLEYANTLLSKGLNTNAAQAFEVYIERTHANNKDLAGICNKLGDIYLDLKEYEKALANFYKSELLDPNSDDKQDMNQKIVSALENSGLSQQAQYELESRTAVKPGAPKSKNVAIRIGKREITIEEIDGVINNFPESVRKELSNDDAKLRFIREYAASEVLYEKGKKLGLDKLNSVRIMIEDFKKKLILQELLRNEVDKELKITPDDISLYYQANQKRYRTPERAKVAFLELSDLAKNNEIASKLKQGKGEKIEEWIEKGSVYLPNNLGESKEAVENIFKQQKGGIVDPVKIKGKLYMFIVNDKQPSTQQGFEEVKQQVEGEYRMQKQQQIVKSFVDRAMEQQEVAILFQPKKTDEKVSK